MKIAMTGSTGLVGTALADSLPQEGTEILAITRRPRSVPPSRKSLHWDPERKELDVGALEGTDVLVHLAGQSIAQRWTDAQKQSIRDSRVEGTRFLIDRLKGLSQKPRVLVSASAIGFYGNREDEELDETSSPGTGYLPEVCQAWEAEVGRASELGIRSVSLRLGLVLSTKGGALERMLLPFKMGLGGPVGSGKQWVSWIHIEDVAGVFRFVMNRDDVSGPINTTAPQPVRQGEFARALGGVLGRPAFLPAPAFALKLALGEMAQALLLDGQRVLPRRLQELGFGFEHPELSEALGDILKHNK